MQKVFVFLVVSITIVLGACNALIPDQTVTNAFGLDGKQVTLTQQAQAGLSQTGLSAQAVSATYSGTLAATFKDLEQNLPGGIRPSSIEESLGLAAELKVASASGEAAFPNSLTITASSLAFTVTDGLGAPTLSQSFNSASGLALVITKKSCTGATTCTYTLSAPSTVLLLVALAGSNFSTFFDILSKGGSPNTLTASFSLVLMGDTLFPADSAVTVTLKTSQGTLKF
jgi:hypothetical protein